MVVDRKATVESLGKSFAELLRDEPDVRELWVTADDEGFVVSIFTENIAPERELELYKHANPVQQQFPETLFEVHILIPKRYSYISFDAMRGALLPPGARKIPLQK